MHHIIYLSSASSRLSREQLHDLLELSRERNRKADVTGALFYQDGSFLQVIEGDKDTITSLYAKIARDPRHTGIITLFSESIPARQFADWSMAFHDVSAGPEDQKAGFSDLLNRKKWNEEDIAEYSPKVRAFLQMFQPR